MGQALRIGGEGFPGDLETAGRETRDHRREWRPLNVQLGIQELCDFAREFHNDAGLLAVCVEILERRIVEGVGDAERAGLLHLRRL